MKKNYRHLPRALTLALGLCVPAVASAQDLTARILSIAVQNDQVSYEVQVCNEGVGNVTSTLGLYYDLANEPDCVTSASWTWNPGNLGHGECKTVTHNRANTPAGKYKAWARADYNCKVNETSEANNNDSKEYSVLPELYVVTATASVTGTTVTYTLTIRNSGATTATGFKLALFYDRASPPTCGATPSKSWDLAGLANNTTLTLQEVRTNTPAGSYLAWFMVDSECTVEEPDENNNIFSRKYSVGPDIYLATPMIEVSGSTVTYSVYVCNLGTINTGSFTVGLWYHEDVLAPCPVGGANHTWTLTNLPAWNGDSGTSCTTLIHTRVNASAGTYTAWFFGDPTCSIAESDESNNLRSRQYPVLAPDFHISSFMATITGTQVDTSATVCNQGATTGIPFVVGLYYNLGSAPSTGMSPDFTWPTVNGLASGECVTLIQSRSNVPSGTYTAWVFADRANAVPEINESNNTQSFSYAIAPSQPDLSVASFAIAVNGSTLTYSALVCNGGTTASSFQVGFYANRMSEPSCADTPDVISLQSGGLAAGTCTLISQSQAGVGPGSYLGWVLVDSACAISEIFDTNNTASSGYTIAQTQAPDLQVETFNVSVAGLTVVFSAKVCNKGTATAQASTLGLFFNRGTAPSDACLDSPDLSATLGSLAPSACEERIWTQTDMPPATYLAWAMADSGCSVAESLENNNTLAKSYAIVSVATDLGISDAGVVQDGGSVSDAGPISDSGPIVDSGSIVDGAIAIDGRKTDAGVTRDGAVAGDTRSVTEGPLRDGARVDSTAAHDAGVRNDSTSHGDGGIRDVLALRDGRRQEGPAPVADGGCGCRISDPLLFSGIGWPFLLAGLLTILGRRGRRTRRKCKDGAEALSSFK